MVSRRVAPPSGEPRSLLRLAVGDVVVYACHGIGHVEARWPAGGDRPETVVLVFESGLKVIFPVELARSTVRPLSGESQLEDVRLTLRAVAAPKVESWSRRFRSTREKVTAGRATALAEVVRDGLQRERQLAAGLSARSPAPSERHLYLQARKLLTAEIAHVREIDAVEADAWIVEQVDDVARATRG